MSLRHTVLCCAVLCCGAYVTCCGRVPLHLLTSARRNRCAPRVRSSHLISCHVMSSHVISPLLFSCHLLSSPLLSCPVMWSHVLLLTAVARGMRWHSTNACCCMMVSNRLQHQRSTMVATRHITGCRHGRHPHRTWTDGTHPPHTHPPSHPHLHPHPHPHPHPIRPCSRATYYSCIQ